MTTYNTGNPLGSSDPRDLYDNAENLDEAVNNTESDSWRDRMGRTRLTWEAIAKAGTGDTGVAIDAANRAVGAAGQAENEADRATGAANRAENAEAVVDAANIEAAVIRAETAADSIKPYVDNALSDLSTAANKFYPTLAEANADVSNITVNQPVHVGEAVNGGLWYKATSGASTLTKSAYDPLAAAEAYTDDYVSRTGLAKIAAHLKTNINYDTATRTLTFSGGVHITTGTSRVQLTTPQSIVLDRNQMYRLEYNVSTGLIGAQAYTQSYFEGYIPFALVRSYPDKIETTDFQYVINGVAFDAVEEATGISAIDATSKVKVLEDSLFGENKNSNLYDDNAEKQTGFYVGATGELVESPTHYVTGFIPVDPNTAYTVSQIESQYNYIVGVAFYDADKQFVSRFNTTSVLRSTGYQGLTTPKGTYYVKLTCQNGIDSIAKRMFYKGSEQIPYESFKPKKIKWAALPDFSDSSATRRGDYLTFTGDRHPAIMLDFPDSYSKDDDRNIAVGTAGQVVYADMVTWWQDLVDEFPDYITKKTIGTDSSGQYDVHSYTFMPDGMVEVDVNPHSNIARPRVLMLVQHIEQMNQVYPLLAMRELCRNWEISPALTALRHEVEFVVIPYAHPWGFEYQNVTGGSYRMTSEGLNTNGDWPYKWNHVDNPNNGTTPFATQEARNVKAVMEEFKPHVFFDLHSAFATQGERTGTWIDAELNGKYVNSVRSATTSFYPMFKEKFPYIDTMDKHLRVTYSNNNRQAPGYGYAMGCVGGLIEFMKNYNYRPAADGLYNDGLIFSSSMLLNIIVNCIAEYRDYGFPNPYPLYIGEGVYDPENGIGI